MRGSITRRFVLRTLALAVCVPAFARLATAADCNSKISTTTISGPAFGVDGSVFRKSLSLGASVITDGPGGVNTLTINTVRFNLDCTHADLPGCTDNGNVITYAANLTTTCETTWTVTSVANGVNFTADPPLVIAGVNPGDPPNIACSLQFDLAVASVANAIAGDPYTPLIVEQTMLYQNTVCSNGLPTSGFTGSAIPLCQICNDNNACTTERCNTTSGACQTTNTVTCADGDPCTDDECDAAAGCTFTPNEAPCDDANACSLDDRCAGGACAATEWLACPRTSACEPGRCDPATGACVVPLKPVCDDGNACTRDICDATRGCLRTQVVCSDGNPATRDSCDPRFGCLFKPWASRTERSTAGSPTQEGLHR